MIKRIKPVSRIVKIEAEINRIMGEIFMQKGELSGLDESWIPYVDISEKRNEIIVEIELPGVNHKDITILLHNTRIEVKGIKREGQPPDNIKYLRLERTYGNFRRFIFLPSAVVPEKAKASLENGILTVILKKFVREGKKEVILSIQKSEE